MAVKLIIDGTLPNLNDYTKACRSNKFAGANMKKKAEDIISLYIKRDITTFHFDAPVEISFTWIEPNKRRDLDNIAFAKKFILDSLVKNGIIETDDWNGVVGFSDSFGVDKDHPRIEVVIEFSDKALPF